MVGIGIVMLAVMGLAFFWAVAPALLLLVVAAYVFATPEHAMHQCLACGHTWKPSAVLSGSDDDDEEDDSAEESDDADQSREQEKAN